MKTILIVDDEPRIRQLIKIYLEPEGFTTIEAENGKVALDVMQRKSVDLVILDLMMPVMDGVEFCKEVRKFSNVMILMLTAKSEETDKLLGYELGTDDYVTKPFSPRVIVAKVKAMLRRLELPVGEDADVFKMEGLEINESSHDVIVEGTSVDFSPKEFDILLLMVRNRGHVLSRDTILNKVWGDDYYGDFRTVDTHIRRIREKLGVYSSLIVTVTGVGYKFEVRK